MSMSFCWCVHVPIWESTFVSVHIFEFWRVKEGEKERMCVCVCVYVCVCVSVCVYTLSV